MTLARPLFAYNHMLAFGHGAPISVSHTRRLPFRSPSEAHSPQLPLPHSHHRRLSGWKHVCDYSLFLNGLFDCPYLSTSGGKCQAFFCEIANFLIWPYLILQIWSLNQSSKKTAVQQIEQNILFAFDYPEEIPAHESRTFTADTRTRPRKPKWH